MTLPRWAASRRLGGLKQPVAALVGIAVVIVGIPKVLSPFELYTAVFAAIYLIAALGLNILSGYGGVISVGTAAFAMVGAYTVGIVNIHLHLNFAIGAGTLFLPSSVPKIDNMAHLGGFLLGLAVGVPLVPKIGAGRDRYRRRQTLVFGGMLILLLTLGYGVASYYGVSFLGL